MKFRKKESKKNSTNENKDPNSETLNKDIENLEPLNDTDNQKKEGEKKTNKVKEVKKTELEIAQQKVNDLTGMIQRLQAEFDNYRKRVDAQREEQKQLAVKDIIESILPTLDNFELALNHAKKDFENNNGEDLVKGVELIFSQLVDILEQKGLTVINPVGEKFTPYEHEALLMEDSDLEKDSVIEVLQKGYKLGSKVIRNAKVKIAK